MRMKRPGDYVVDAIVFAVEGVVWLAELLERRRARR